MAALHFKENLRWVAPAANVGVSLFWILIVLIALSYSLFLANGIEFPLVDDALRSTTCLVHERGGIALTLYDSFVAFSMEQHTLWTSRLFQRALWEFWRGDVGAANITLPLTRFAHCLPAYLIARPLAPHMNWALVELGVVSDSFFHPIVLEVWLHASGSLEASPSLALLHRAPHATLITIRSNCSPGVGVQLAGLVFAVTAAVTRSFEGPRPPLDALATDR